MATGTKEGATTSTHKANVIYFLGRCQWISCLLKTPYIRFCVWKIRRHNLQLCALVTFKGNTWRCLSLMAVNLRLPSKVLSSGIVLLPLESENIGARAPRLCAIRLDYPSHGSIHTSSKLCSHFWNATGSSSAWATTSVLNPSLAKTSMCFTVSSIAWMQWYVRNDFRLFGV